VKNSSLDSDLVGCPLRRGAWIWVTLRVFSTGGFKSPVGNGLGSDRFRIG
jgi:hypothetical protein